MNWKKSYLESLVDALSPKGGDVLLVGFGNGDAAARIQTFKPKSLTIIESNPQTAESARVWSQSQNQTKVIEGTWQTVLPTLQVFDTFFFDDYALGSDVEALRFINPEEVTKASNQSKELLKSLEQEMAQIDVQFSDREIEDFYQKIGKFQPQELSMFFKTLKDKGCITEKQYEDALRRYSLKKSPKSPIEPVTQADPMLAFIEECLKSHSRKGSRFSGYFLTPTSKYQDTLFFDRIITNPDLDFTESTISIPGPENKPLDGLIAVIERIV